MDSQPCCRTWRHWETAQVVFGAPVPGQRRKGLIWHCPGSVLSPSLPYPLAARLPSTSPVARTEQNSAQHLESSTDQNMVLSKMQWNKTCPPVQDHLKTNLMEGDPDLQRLCYKFPAPGIMRRLCQLSTASKANHFYFQASSPASPHAKQRLKTRGPL